MADDPDARPEFAEVEAQCRALAAMTANGTLAESVTGSREVAGAGCTDAASPEVS